MKQPRKRNSNWNSKQNDQSKQTKYEDQESQDKPNQPAKAQTINKPSTYNSSLTTERIRKHEMAPDHSQNQHDRYPKQDLSQMQSFIKDSFSNLHDDDQQYRSAERNEHNNLSLAQFKLSHRREVPNEINIQEFKITNDNVNNQTSQDKLKSKLVNSQYLFQNNICKFQLSGKCKKGANCKFRHLSSEEIEREMSCKFDTGNLEDEHEPREEKKPLLLMMDTHQTPKRLVWNMHAKGWEWRNEPDASQPSDCAALDAKTTPKRNGWCWEGIHCTNPQCKFKHRNLPPVDSNPHSSLPSSIRGPRQHKATSNMHRPPRVHPSMVPSLPTNNQECYQYQEQSQDTYDYDNVYTWIDSNGNCTNQDENQDMNNNINNQDLKQLQQCEPKEQLQRNQSNISKVSTSVTDHLDNKMSMASEDKHDKIDLIEDIQIARTNNIERIQASAKSDATSHSKSNKTQSCEDRNSSQSQSYSSERKAHVRKRILCSFNSQSLTTTNLTTEELRSNLAQLGNGALTQQKENILNSNQGQQLWEEFISPSRNQQNNQNQFDGGDQPIQNLNLTSPYMTTQSPGLKDYECE